MIIIYKLNSMIDYKIKLADYVALSRLGEEQRKLWGLFTKAALPDEAEAVYEAVSEEEGNLELLTKYLRDKIWEMKERDQAAWARIAAEEKGAAEALEVMMKKRL